MTDARYLLTDVFTAAPFGGNQLTVFPDAAGLETVPSGEVRRLTITQGVEMGRPSTIETETHFAAGKVAGVSVGGGAVVVGEGRFSRLP